MSILLAVIGAIIVIVIALLYFVFRSEIFVKRYCSMLFKQKQHHLLNEISKDSRITKSKNGDFTSLLEVLQDCLWSRSKKLDESISNHIFDLETILDIAYIAWFIFFIHKTYDVSKLEKTN